MNRREVMQGVVAGAVGAALPTKALSVGQTSGCEETSGYEEILALPHPKTIHFDEMEIGQTGWIYQFIDGYQFIGSFKKGSPYCALDVRWLDVGEGFKEVGVHSRYHTSILHSHSHFYLSRRDAFIALIKEWDAISRVSAEIIKAQKQVFIGLIQKA